MIIPAVSITLKVQPTPRPVPVVTGRVIPHAGKSFNHISGQVRGSLLTYADLNAFAWYTGRERTWKVIQLDARNSFRGLSGEEDSTRTRR